MYRRTPTVVAATLVAAACAAPADTPPEPVTLTATDYAFAIADTVTGGFVNVSFRNNGREEHHAQIVRLNDGVTQTQFRETLAAVMQAAQTEGEAAFMKFFEIATLAGGPGVIAPGNSVDVVADLAPGNYALMCFVAGPDGVPHIAKDMLKFFTVSAPADAAATTPTAAFTVNLADFAFSDLPATLPAGRTTIEAHNAGPEPHEMIVLKLDDGVTVQQLMQMMESPPPADSTQPPPAPPFTSMGGVQGLMPGGKGWVTLDLSSGNYVLVCFIPSPANQGAPHIALGMMKEFRVN